TVAIPSGMPIIDTKRHILKLVRSAVTADIFFDPIKYTFDGAMPKFRRAARRACVSIAIA
ncbi:hypothetical protein N9C81_01040, partial [Planctomycetota bacterium]|nr:hypothetical protein [Planctomycetota bacterium]